MGPSLAVASPPTVGEVNLREKPRRNLSYWTATWHSRESHSDTIENELLSRSNAGGFGQRPEMYL